MSGFKPEALDLSHHLSTLAKNRQTSPLKGLQRFLNKPGLIQLAGGLPSPAYFPFADLSSNILVADSFPLTVNNAGSPDHDESAFSWLWKLFGSDEGKEKTTPVTVPKYSLPQQINLATALQYGLSGGLPQLQKLVTEFSGRVYQPAYENWKTLLHAGNTDAWNKVVITLCNPGEGVFVSKWTYPSAMASMTPYNILPVPVDIDSEGMRSDDLRAILSGWDQETRGMPRPRVIYTVPVGENPTGLTTGLQRKKEIYQLCVEFGAILVEDDPYFILQEGVYAPKEKRANTEAPKSDEEFIASLEPSYLNIDYQGRVIRLDTFSKTMAPGCRLGWYTCNPMFAERLERAAETSTQAPCGFSQSLVATTLLEWGTAGYLRWLKGLRVQYTVRRDFLVDCFADEFNLSLEPAAVGDIWEGCQVYHGSVKRKNTVFWSEKAAHSTPLFSFVPPSSGMFIWLKVHLDQHPAYATLGVKELEQKLWIEFAEAGLLIGPGTNIGHITAPTNMFAGAMFNPTNDFSNVRSGHFRVSFSNAENAELKKASEIFATVLRKFMSA
ncbi:Aminotran-1-2 domain-containing protein [Mycena kentingensis (nom. inval.)]|nr:Aminotran-1-2 domain-containing protein [Mycena kentingensis (nom. inval.)]